MAINTLYPLKDELTSLNLMVSGLKFTSISIGYNAEKYLHTINLKYVKRGKEHTVRCSVSDNEVIQLDTFQIRRILIDNAYEAVYNIEVKGEQPDATPRNNSTLSIAKQGLKNIRLLWKGKRRQKNRSRHLS